MDAKIHTIKDRQRVTVHRNIRERVEFTTILGIVALMFLISAPEAAPDGSRSTATIHLELLRVM